MINNPNDPVIYEILRRLRDLETTAPGGSTAVSRGRTRFVGNESVLVEGSGKVSGWWIVTGVLRVVGTLQMLGNMLIEGVMTLTGTMNVTGNIEILPGGKLKVGGMVIDPADGGSVQYPGGAVVKGAPGGGVEIIQGAYAATITSSGASIGKSGRSFSVTDVGFQMWGVPEGSPGNGTPYGVYYRDPLGMIRVSDGL